MSTSTYTYVHTYLVLLQITAKLISCNIHTRLTILSHNSKVAVDRYKKVINGFIVLESMSIVADGKM